MVGEVRYFTDEHVPTAVVIGLRARGVDVLTVAEAGRRGTSDDEHLAFALSEGRVMVTQDDDFLGLTARGAAHAGLVYAPQRTSIGEMVRGLTLIHHVLSAEDMVGIIEFI